MPTHITPVGNATHSDFFSLEGTGFADDAVLEFSTPVGTITVTPDFIRPHLALVARLPTTLPVGAATVRLTSASVPASNSVSVAVTAGPPATVRLLQAGEAKARPYVIAFIGNPAIEAATGSTFTPDSILTNRPGFHKVVAHCFANLFTVAEDLLRLNSFESRVRIVAVFDPLRPANAANALAHEVPGSNIMETRRAVLAPFLANFGIVADMVYVIHGSTTHDRASAWFTTDEAGAGTPYTYDGVARSHGHLPRIPGSAALAVSMPTDGLTVLHEFGHAASDFNNGKVTDLYDDAGRGTGFLVNKKFRLAATDPVPPNFATYHGTAFAADAARDGLTYPNDWRSYHPSPVDGTRPNLMDNYWWASDDPQLCRLDQLTHRWFQDRLQAKLNR